MSATIASMWWVARGVASGIVIRHRDELDAGTDAPQAAKGQ